MTRKLTRVSLTILLISAASLIAGAALSQGQRPYETGKDAVPEWVKDRAMAFVESNYRGNAKAIYQRARTTLRYWAEVEPNNAGPDRVGPGNADSAVYAIFFEGVFHTSVPVTSDPQYLAELEAKDVSGAEFYFGRILLNPRGDLLSLQLWQERKPADPPFGERFEDS